MAKKNSSIDRAKILANVVIQTATVFLLVLMVNYLAFNHFKRWDFSRTRKYTLTRQTHNVLDGLVKPVKLIVYFAGGSEIARDVGSLVKEYAWASRKLITVETVNPFLNMTRAREVSTKYKLGSGENVVILDCDGRSKTVNAADMADYEPALNPVEKPRLAAFKGEQTLTSALIELSEPGSNKVYVITGHGEPGTASEMHTGLATYIQRQNVSLENLKLADIDAIPTDAKALLIAGPRYDFTDRDLRLLRAYWNHHGRLLVLFDPGAPVPNLGTFLDDVGVTVNSDRVLKTVPYGPVTGVLKEITGDFVDGSPITKRLGSVTAVFLGTTQSLRLDPDRVKPLNIRLQPLITASKGFWATAHYEVGNGRGVYFNPKLDTPSPVVAASVEKGALSDERVRVDSSRMVAVGNCAFIRNDDLTEADLDFFLSAINWLLDREHLIGIAPKSVHSFALSLTEAQIGNLAMLTMCAIPGAAAVLGLMVWLKRRR